MKEIIEYVDAMVDHYNMKFNYSMEACFPQIPRVQDVLYALRLSEDDHEGYYKGACNWPTYVSAVHKVAALIGWRLMTCTCSDWVGEYDCKSTGVDPKCPRPAKYESQPTDGCTRCFRESAKLDLPKARLWIAAAIVALTPDEAKNDYDFGQAEKELLTWDLSAVDSFEEKK